MNYENEIKNLKDRIDRAQMNKVRAETRLEQLEKEKDALLAEMKEYGVEPDTLEQEIQRLEQELATLLQQANDLLPKE